MCRVVLPPIIRSAYNCIYSIWYLSHRYCYLPLSWKSWNRVECAVGGLRHPQHTQTGSNFSTTAADSSNGVTKTRRYNTVVCAPDDGWKYHPKHVEQFPDINKLFNVASCWIYEYIGILLGARPILHISRIRVNNPQNKKSPLSHLYMLHWHTTSDCMYVVTRCQPLVSARKSPRRFITKALYFISGLPDVIAALLQMSLHKVVTSFWL